MAYLVSREIEFCYGHRLPDHGGKCRFLHGHNGRVEITIASEKLDPNGMVLDFGEIRSGIEKWIDEELDHHTLLFHGDPLVPLLKEAGQKVVVMETIPTAENIAQFIFQKGGEMGLRVVQVRVWETSRNSAVYSAEN
ncbi:MAG: 6-carboxytetrahydropterin synthase [Thermoguttaceae bacterium]|nr:6-carboxytetrahydropterin synthase [Planctomycetaceae bacterium]MBQ4142481.1 6-carboxytetrahydropterin synthase [Thermoguttaceae bacterium]